MYMSKYEVESHKNLTLEREAYLISTRHTEESRHEIIKYNMPLVFKYAKWFSNKYNVDVRLLISDGITGILVALDRYKSDRDARFNTYASWWVMRCIQRSSKKLAKTRVMELTDGDDDVDYDSKATSEDKNDDSKERQEARQEVEEHLSRLRPDQRELMKARYGISPYAQIYSQRDIGAALGITHSRVQQLEEEAVNALRSTGWIKPLRPYWYANCLKRAELIHTRLSATY